MIKASIIRLRILFLFAACGVALFYPSVAASQGSRPNILFFYIDDLGWKDLVSYGSEFYETPAIDELAMQGFRFTSAYQAAARCVPSRTSLFTGKYHERPGISDSKGVVLEEYTFAEAFHDAGYRTFFTGKWHLGSDSTRYPDKQGFDINVGGCEWGSPSGSEEGGGRYFSPYDCPTLTDGPTGEYLTDRLTRETIDFITGHQATQPETPFLACVFHYAVHTPIEAPESYTAHYVEKLAAMEYDLPAREIDGPAKVKLRQDHPVYAGMIASVDESVKNIRKSLDELGISDNTIIIFSTDHGGLSTTLKSSGREISTSNYPLRTGKGWLYEGGIRSPLIIYWPGVTQSGVVTDALVTGLDIYPTMLEMAGLPLVPQQHLDGQSFVPLLRGEEWSRKGPMMWYFPLAKTGTGNPNMAALRVEDHKLIHFMLQDRFELYDLQQDVSESHNLASEKPEITNQMKDILFAVESETEMPAIASNRIKVEEQEILPEYPVSIGIPDYPVMNFIRMEELESARSLQFTLEIRDENPDVHPVDLRYYYRSDEDPGWMEITSMEGEHFRLLPGVVENRWNYTGFEGKTLDFTIKGSINNELFPVEIGEEIITGVPIIPPVKLQVPEGRRLREIVADKYWDDRLLIGGTTGSWAFGEPNGTIMDREFSYLTPENDFKHSTVRKDINAWKWEQADVWLQHIIDHQQVLRIHGPIGPQCSDWAKDDSRTAAELSGELATFLTSLCQRYSNVTNIEYMDVVNETVTRSGNWMGPKPGVDDWENPWTTIGFETAIPSSYPTLDSVPLYIIQAFEIAGNHAPDLKLVLNQHGGMEEGMWDQIKELVLYLRNEKSLRIDALGWQAHIETGWETEDDNMLRLSDLIDWCQSNELEFHVTEFDSWILDKNKHDFEDQSETYKAVMDILVEKSVYGKIAWNTWHISDAHGSKVERSPALFNVDYNAKPAYYAIQASLENGLSENSIHHGFRGSPTLNENDSSVKLFPNPATRSIRLESGNRIRGINIYDQTGRKVLTEHGINSLNHEIIIAGLDEGIYLVEISFMKSRYLSYLKMLKLN